MAFSGLQPTPEGEPNSGCVLHVVSPDRWARYRRFCTRDGTRSMNGWTSDEITRLEERAAKIKKLFERATYLHRQTGLGWHVCIVWAQFIRLKFKLSNGNGT